MPETFATKLSDSLWERLKSEGVAQPCDGFD